MNYITLSKDIVKKACEEFLDERRSWINKCREEIIQERMNGFFRRISREKAIDKLNASDDLNAWHMLNVPGGRDAMVVENLLSLCNISKDVVTIDADAARILESFIKQLSIEKSNQSSLLCSDK